MNKEQGLPVSGSLSLLSKAPLWYSASHAYGMSMWLRILQVAADYKTFRPLQGNCREQRGEGDRRHQWGSREAGASTACAGQPSSQERPPSNGTCHKIQQETTLRRSRASQSGAHTFTCLFNLPTPPVSQLGTVVLYQSLQPMLSAFLLNFSCLLARGVGLAGSSGYSPMRSQIARNL